MVGGSAAQPCCLQASRGSKMSVVYIGKYERAHVLVALFGYAVNAVRPTRLARRPILPIAIARAIVEGTDDIVSYQDVYIGCKFAGPLLEAADFDRVYGSGAAIRATKRLVVPPCNVTAHG